MAPVVFDLDAIGIAIGLGITVRAVKCPFHSFSKGHNARVLAGER